MKQSKASFSLKVDRGYRKDGISFPTCQAELTDELVDRLKMDGALGRLAKALTLQFRKKDKCVRGVFISSVNFQFVFQRKTGERKEPPCPKKT